MPNIRRRIAFLLIITILAAYLAVPTSAEEKTNGERIYVLGAVHKPGDYEFYPGIDAKAALDLAGGLTEAADPTGVVLVRANGEKANLDIKAIQEARTKIVLAAGDTIVAKPRALTNAAAPARTFSASITGEINQPGGYTLEMGRTDNLAALLEAAGGATSKADLSHVRISSIRGSERTTVIVDASNTSTRRTVIIQPDDAVFIPQPEPRVRRHRTSLSDVYLATVILYTIVKLFRND